MKNLFFFFVFLSTINGWGQVYLINEGFNTATAATPATGWTSSGLGTPYATGGVSSPSLKFDDVNDYLITPTFTCGDQLSFWLKGNPSSGSNIVGTFTVEGFNGSTYTTISTITNQSSTASTYTYSISSTFVSIRFTFSSKTSGNLALDDVKIRQGSCSNTITTGAVSTSPFTLDCTTNATGTVAYTSAGTFTAGNIYTAELSDALGNFTSPTTIGSLNSTSNTGSINITIPTGTVSGTLYRIRVVSTTPAIIGTDNGTNLTITNNCTITTGTVSSSNFSVSCSTGSAGTVDFTASGSMQTGNIYSVQLSDASGNFTASTTIGTLSSTASSGTISFTIPASTPTGSGYLIRVISSNPSTTGSSSSVLSITLTDGPCVQEPPHLTSVIINSCDPTCAEGYNEIVFGTSGDYSFTVNTSNFDFLYGSTNPGTNYTDVLVNNTTGINQLNTAAGCPGLFVDATGTTVPPNASWMLVYTDICEEALTWSGLCGTGPIYVIFQNDPNWNTSGNFANNPDAATPTRYFRTAISTTSGNTFTINYTTNGSYPNSDGVYATFDSNGGAATVYGDNNCILSPALLPSSLLSFGGTYVNSQTELTWQTVSEQNNAFFTLMHSVDGENFQQIGTIKGAGNSTEFQTYRFIHNYPHPGVNYYRLYSTDYDGTNYYKGIVAIDATFNFTYFNSQTATIELAYESDISIYAMDGKLIEEKNDTKSIHFNQSGMFIILDRRSGITERLFVP